METLKQTENNLEKPAENITIYLRSNPERSDYIEFKDGKWVVTTERPEHSTQPVEYEEINDQNRERLITDIDEVILDMTEELERLGLELKQTERRYGDQNPEKERIENMTMLSSLKIAEARKVRDAILKIGIKGVEKDGENIEKSKVEWGETAPVAMDWPEAMNWCDSRGESWRMPTSLELKTALEDKVAGFKNGTFYWTSYHYGGSSSRFGYDDEGKVIGDYDSKKMKHSVRCVRNITA